MYAKEASEYEKLYSLDVLGVEDRGEDTEERMISRTCIAVSRRVDGQYEVSVPWIPGSSLSS